MSAPEHDDIKKEGTLTNYYQIVHYLLETHVTDDITAKAEAAIMNYKQPKNICAVCYSETLRKTALTHEKITMSQDFGVFSERDYNTRSVSLQEISGAPTWMPLYRNLQVVLPLSSSRKEGSNSHSINSHADNRSRRKRLRNTNQGNLWNVMMTISSKPYSEFSSSS